MVSDNLLHKLDRNLEGKISVRKDYWGQEGPHVESKAKPWRDDFNPYSRHVTRDGSWKYLSFL